MRNERFVNGEYFHIFNRGNNKNPIFWDEYDYARFLTQLLFCQGQVPMPRILRLAPFVLKAVKNNERLESIVSETGKKLIGETMVSRVAALSAFCLMPNHFHAKFKQLKKNGISSAMQRLGNSHTKYINEKYQRTGHVFTGAFKAVHILDNDQLLDVSVYIHNNPRELRAHKEKPHAYPWSSFRDYVQKNRWGRLLDRSLVLSQFNDMDEYKTFVSESETKL